MDIMQRALFVLIAFVAGFIAALVITINAPTYGATAPTHKSWTNPCQHEDGPGPCVWDARERGNGKGNSYLINSSGLVREVPHRVARVLITKQTRPWVTPCLNEDGPGPCIWNARGMGNGHGESYILRRDGRQQPIPHRVARVLT